MNYKIPALILCVFVLTMSSEESYGAVYQNAGKLHEFCNEPKSSDIYWQHLGRCQHYIVGVVDTWQYAVIVGAGAIREGFCLPENITIGQFIAVTSKHLKEHPERWHYQAQGEVLVALMEAFPCE